MLIVQIATRFGGVGTDQLFPGDSGMNTAFGRMQVRKLCCGSRRWPRSGPEQALGVIYVEVPDAGESLATAQNVNMQPGGTALDAIEGVLTGGADLFKINILTGGGTFPATHMTVSSLAFNNSRYATVLVQQRGDRRLRERRRSDPGRSPRFRPALIHARGIRNLIPRHLRYRLPPEECRRIEARRRRLP